MAKAILPVITNCPEGREAEFNHWYNTVHVPDILQAPGFVACTRYQMVGTPREGQGKLLALYEIEAEEPCRRRPGPLPQSRPPASGPGPHVRWHPAGLRCPLSAHHRPHDQVGRTRRDPDMSGSAGAM